MKKFLFLVLAASLALSACGAFSSPLGTPAATTTPTADTIATSVASTLQAMPTPTAQSTATPRKIPFASLTPTSTLVPLNPTATQAATESGTGEDGPVAVDSVETEGWTITYFTGADLDRGDGTTFRGDAEKWDIRKLAPEKWLTFPNEPNPLVPEFRVVNGNQTPDGLEYGEDESGYCEQDERCDIVVPAEHYRIVTGDYKLPFDECKSTEENPLGCGFVIFNVGRVSTGIEDVSVDFGFTVWGRYFNGDALPMAIWGSTSHVGANMLDLESTLNPQPLGNAGANCSVPEGCPKVRLAFFVMSGNELLMSGITYVSK